MKPRDALIPVSTGFAAFALSVAPTMGVLYGLEWNAERQAEAAANAQEGATQDQLDEYFSGFDHLEVTADIDSSGILLGDISVELVPDKLEGPSAEVAERLNLATVRLARNEVPEGSVSGLIGSGFIMQDGAGNIRFMTAGHVADSISPGMFNAFTNDATRVDITEIDAHYSETDTQISEDIAVGTLENPESFRDRALQPRNLTENPLRIGEPLHLLNFQQHRPIGRAISYTMIYTGPSETSDRFIVAMGDIMQDQGEDEILPGASGGVVVDDNGEVVGISVATTAGGEDEPSYTCEQTISLDTQSGLFGRVDKTTVDLVVPPTNDECDSGMSAGIIRTVGNLATSGQVG